MKLFYFFISIFFYHTAFSQTHFTVSGTLHEEKSGEAMIGVTVSVKQMPHTGVVSNAYGFYSLSLKPDLYRLFYRFTGYNDIDTLIELNRNIQLNLTLTEKINQMKEAVIIGEAANKNVSSSQMGIEKISIKEISVIPVFFGEKDLLKTIQLLPGIKGISEGNSGFYVRGGSADQNLILLDEATIYNPSHVLGFFSVFNSDAIKDITIYKSGIPAEYGGRISSVLDIKMNDGNNKQFKTTGGIGLIASRLTLEGPVVKNKSSFIISARRSYADMYARAFGPPQIKNTIMYFYDLNLKVSYQIGIKDRIFFSGYFGKDNFVFDNNKNRRIETYWSNKTATFRWNHIFNSKLFFNSSLLYNNYKSNFILGTGNAQFAITTGIRDFSLKEDFQYYFSAKHSFKFGLQSTLHTFTPGEVSLNTSDINSIKILDQTIEKKYASESGLYVSDNYKFNSRVTINYGIRFSVFNNLGPSTVFSFDETGNINDSSIYSKYKIYNTYAGIEPRISVVYLLNESSSVKAAYHHINQYLQLLTNTTASTPIDLWIPSGKLVKPQISDQISLGYYKNFKNNMYETSAEAYYKNMQNQIDYKDGADLRLNKAVESQLYFGRGWAYGIEMLVKKKQGNFTGWIGYTLSRTLRQFDNINFGNVYPARQDIINSISIVTIYQISKRLTVSAVWVYQTGFAVTFPSGTYYFNGNVYNLYTERNGYRMPAYHRMDLGLTWKGKPKPKYESSWNFSVYNVYARENAYSITFQKDLNAPYQNQAVQLSLFSVVPAITYNFKF